VGVWTGVPSLPNGYGLTSTQHGFPGDGLAGGAAAGSSEPAGVIVAVVAVCVQLGAESASAALAVGARHRAGMRMFAERTGSKKRRRMARDASPALIEYL
jgi:hypothetical protein